MDLNLKSVCLFGDSIAKGIILDEDSGRYSIGKASFATTAAQALGVILDNKARFGCTIKKGQEIVTRILSSEAKNPPIDYALLEFGGNDCDFDWQEISKSPEEIHLPKTPIDEFIKIYKQIIEALRSKQIRPVILTLPPIAADSYYKWISKGNPDKDNIMKWLCGNVEYIYQWHERYNSAVWEVASATSCTVIDIRKAFLEDKNYKQLICSDGIHLNLAGHMLARQTIVDSARKL